MSTLEERMEALLSQHPLPPMKVDLACWRRLEAFRDRLVKEDPPLGSEPDAMEHVIYAAIMEGLWTAEKDAGVRYEENTGRKLG